MKINFYDLENGSHEFEFSTQRGEIDLENDIHFVNEIHVKSTLHKSDLNIVVKTIFETLGEFVCDRCLEPFTKKVKDEFVLYYTGDKDLAESDDEQVIRVLGTNKREIDLRSGVRESLLLTLPIKVLCRENCKGLSTETGKNLNEAIIRGAEVGTGIGNAIGAMLVEGGGFT